MKTWLAKLVAIDDRIIDGKPGVIVPHPVHDTAACRVVWCHTVRSIGEDRKELIGIEPLGDGLVAVHCDDAIVVELVAPGSEPISDAYGKIKNNRESWGGVVWPTRAIRDDSGKIVAYTDQPWPTISGSET